MHRVLFLPSRTSVDVEPGQTILDAARKAAITIETPCNGAGTCGKCKVALSGRNVPEPSAGGVDKLSVGEEGAGLVLACRTPVREDLTVILGDAWKRESVSVLETGMSTATEVDPFIRKEFITAERRTVIYGGSREIGSEPGNSTDTPYGVVVDIGTTTLVAALVDLKGGKERASTSALNPQSLHGQDVLSRIKLASSTDGLDLLHNLFVEETDHMIGELTAKTGVPRENIYELVYSGNTCMLHLAAHTDPSPLGRYPYSPAFRGGGHLPPSKYRGIHIADSGVVYLPPIVSGFVGADITSGVLATRLHERKGVTLFIDIGTNGEMVIAKEGRLTAASTAAGPAFEGMNITFGMRAGTGAIESFELNGGSEPVIGTMGDGVARGICGSGLMDIVGELVSHRVIDRNGRLVRPDVDGALGERLSKKDGKPVFHLTDTVYLSQGDVRQVQLAKGAIRTGVEYLLRHVGIGPKDVDEVLIAGAFGFHLREKNLIATGLLPQEFAGRIDFVGNTSKTGGIAFLVNQGYRREIEEVVRRIETIELANYPDFDRTFVGFLRF
jgi:uncharacterized 2Fe-2S/4Fe-4S cluster protein (DUF4445 family)